MRRYWALTKQLKNKFKNYARAIFVAAQDGREAIAIMNDLLTEDEQLKIGRRIAAAKLLTEGYSYDEVIFELRVGANMLVRVSDLLENGNGGIEIVLKRLEKEEQALKENSFAREGGSKKVFKKKVRTGYSVLDETR